LAAASSFAHSASPSAHIEVEFPVRDSRSPLVRFNPSRAANSTVSPVVVVLESVVVAAGSAAVESVVVSAEALPSVEASAVCNYLLIKFIILVLLDK